MVDFKTDGSGSAESRRWVSAMRLSGAVYALAVGEPAVAGLWTAHLFLERPTSR